MKCSATGFLWGYKETCWSDVLSAGTWVYFWTWPCKHNSLCCLQVLQVPQGHEGPLGQLLTKVTQALQVSLVFWACEAWRATWDSLVQLDSLEHLDSKVILPWKALGGVWHLLILTAGMAGGWWVCLPHSGRTAGFDVSVFPFGSCRFHYWLQKQQSEGSSSYSSMYP